ncbi:MAG: site-specific integrase [gamma proteobacterium symbiont of Bathyaustriella thionipta]|nr:site-specific integrase [gamma proteobacterium symbiont of Bathyaustriella thionipta]MCU7951412.1 site-specific integrase [gamma proteobacterium symbiont of Bathyaustriella thionipta]MCU7953515.1 site-specific integrase [gamma proteobacterium symbiont of Bathyaustriella thionipta]MCU7957964.1 site-specific integrase [gamma proteobacterium symbiont of Bathyaustriella thionipta]MCU7968823.1 site-specific integrase [gamma proteobacterium symbiont of Bathyaustriella thionipta]
MKFSKQSKAWLLDSPLFAYIETYKQYCIPQAYSAETIKDYLYCFAHFAHWLTQSRLDIHYINEQTIHTFIHDYLSKCNNISEPYISETQSALFHLINMLHSRLPEHQQAEKTPVDIELQSFNDHLHQVKGLARTTCRQYLYIIKRLLTEQFSQGPVTISAIKPEDVRQFISRQKQFYTTGDFGPLISALRGYFRYRLSLGDQVNHLIGVANYPANWQFASLPKTLSSEEVASLLKSLDEPDGRLSLRTKAIVHCALDLGLRGGEIARLSLDDIDWQSGTITLKKTKGQREDIMPLPAALGAALANYLKHERPKTINNRSVFVRNAQLQEHPITYDFIRYAIRQAYAHAGLSYTRAHLLRHTMAGRLLEQGSSLKEIADVLRHCSLNTTMIYAKLDSRSLREVALPWPGGAS